MPAGFIRRFTSDPTLAELLAIEGVVIIDREPPATLAGIPTGIVALVGEFEDGPFATEPDGSQYIGGPRTVANGQDFLVTFGSFGYTYDNVQGSNPCARARRADAALVPEYWNGNGFIAAVNKRFGGLVVTRVDTSVGSVDFTRLASISGNADFTWSLSNSQTLVFDIGLGNVTATFTGSVATLLSAAGTYPSTFVGGETLTLTVEGRQFTVVFLAADQTQAQVIARVNQTLGYTAFVDAGGGTTRFNGVIQGTNGAISVDAQSVLVGTAIGFTAPSADAGGGNVSNLAAVAVNEVNAVVNAASSAVRVDRDATGAIRMIHVGGGGTGSLLIDSTSTATAFGFPTEIQSSQPSGFAELTSGVMPVPTGFVGGETITLGIDEEPNVTVTFLVGDQTAADVISRVNLAFGFTFATLAAADQIRYTGRANGGQVRVVAASAALVLTELGLAVGVTQALAVEAGSIPAGTRVRTATGVEFVTMQTVAVDEDDAGPHSAKIRHALDDGTGLGTGVSTVNVVFAPIVGAAYSVTNLLPITAAKTEAQLDALYSLAFDETKKVGTDAKFVTIIVSARQSNIIRNRLKTNAIEAGEQGCFGRVACIRPPLRTTTRAMARSNVAQPGVGAYRSQNVIYNFPGTQTFVPTIALRGLSGGAGFTADGIIDVGSDAWLASLLSQLPPEENPGQVTTFVAGMLGVEKANADVQTLSIDDYKLFKAAGICAPRFDGGDAIFQSGVTSVDPLVQPNLKNISRRRMSYYIQDSLAPRLNAFSKKLATTTRKALIVGEVNGFMGTLLSKQNPELARIAGYEINTKDVNTAETEALGQFRIKLLVRLLPSLDVIVLDVTAGESVVISEAA